MLYAYGQYGVQFNVSSLVFIALAFLIVFLEKIGLDLTASSRTGILKVDSTVTFSQRVGGAGTVPPALLFNNRR